jgi:hypothetical protein
MNLVENTCLAGLRPFDLAEVLHHQISCRSTFAFNESAKPEACPIET